jgi:hypothetical protein
MRKIAVPTIFGALLVLSMQATPASAQATRTWVSGVGDDVNPCSRTAPCKTYAGAISKTATGGEINCLDPGGFGTLTITKSISVVCDYSEGGVLAAGVPGFIINAPAGSIVTLKGQDIEGVGTCTDGIRMVGVGVSLHVHKTQIRNCRGASASGIAITPSSGTAEVFVADSYITGNGTTNTTAGIRVAPTGTGAVRLVVNRTQIEDNSTGILYNAAGSTGQIRGIVRDSSVAGSANDGIAATSTGTSIRVLIDNVAVVSNAATGLSSTGTGSILLAGNSTVTANNTGVVATAPGQVLTFGTNKNALNISSDGAFTQPPIAQQ